MEHFWLAVPSTGFADFSIRGDFRETECRRLLRESGLTIGRIGRASPQFKITRGGPAVSQVARGRSGEYGQPATFPIGEQMVMKHRAVVVAVSFVGA
jgi:hypothetical protein